jgi:hypothetical protein
VRNRHNPIELPYGEIRAFRASIPDTYFTIPARITVKGKTVKGFLSYGYFVETDEEKELQFKPEAAEGVEHSTYDGCQGDYTVTEPLQGTWTPADGCSWDD